MGIRTIRNSNPSDLFNDLAAVMVGLIRSSTAPHYVIALPGGRSVVGLLAAMYPAFRGLSPTILQSLHFFSIDERVVPLTSPDSNYKMLHENFFSRLIGDGLIMENQLHPFNKSGKDVSLALREYDLELEKTGGRFDLSVLGVGEDGHIAGLFPNHHSVKSDATGFIQFLDSPKPPANRMTASKNLVETSAAAVALFIGEAKRQAYENFQEGCAGKLAAIDCPALLVNSASNVIIGTDLAND